MNSSFRNRNEDAAIAAAAAAWLGRSDGGLSSADEAEMARWLQADSRHADAFARLSATSRKLDRLGLLRPARYGAPDPDLPLRGSARGRRWISLAAAAAAVAVTCVVWWRATANPASFSQTASTEIGGLRTLFLPDGSNIVLNTDSAIVVRFTRAERRVRLLRGEARFAVAKNPARPFVVETAKVAVRAVGTAFDVRKEAESVEVLVTEGRVQVSDVRHGDSLVAPVSGRPMSRLDAPVVAASECVVISLRPDAAILPPKSVTPEQISQMLAWESRELRFDPMPLSVLVKEFNRYNRQKLVVADPAIADFKIGGVFRSDDYETFVRLLESSFGVAAERSGDNIFLRARR